jgi:hypothetical protein
MAGADDHSLHQMPADDALDKAKATAVDWLVLAVEKTGRRGRCHADHMTQKSARSHLCGSRACPR